MHRNTEKVILWIFLFFALSVWDFRNAGTFPQNLFYHLNQIRIFVPVHGLLKYPRKFGFRPILGRWRSILWRFPAILYFGATEPDLQLFLLHLRTAFFQAHLLSPSKIWQLWFPKSYKVFMEPPYTIVTSYESCHLRIHNI